MLYIYIRTCPRDDFIGRLAYESLIQIYPTASFAFLAEKGSYSHLTGYVVIREKADNFGGQLGVRNLLNTLRSMNIVYQDNDLIFISDADIVAWNSVLHELDGIDHAGVMNTERWGLGHISGQFQIVSGRFLNRLLQITDDQTQSVIDEMITLGVDVLDDTFISFMSDRWNLVKKHVVDWIHHKFYQFNGRTDYGAILSILSQQKNNETSTD